MLSLTPKTSESKGLGTRLTHMMLDVDTYCALTGVDPKLVYVLVYVWLCLYDYIM